MRKAVDLEIEVIQKLQKLATKDKRKLKNYLEIVLIEHSKKAEEKQEGK